MKKFNELTGIELIKEGWSKFEVNGEIGTDKIKWALIDEIDEETKTMMVTDEDGELYEVDFEEVNYYHPPKF